MPQGLNLVGNSLKVIGCDSIYVGGNTFTVVDTNLVMPITITFTVELTSDVPEGTQLSQRLELIRKYKFGPDMDDLMDQMVITTRKK